MKYEKKIGDKKAIIFIGLDVDGKFGGQGLCPYCGTGGKVVVSGFRSRQAAAKAFFSEMSFHYRKDHKK